MINRYEITVLDKDGLKVLGTFVCPENQNVLVAMDRSLKNFIKVGCRQGGCGVCKIEVLSGDYTKLKMSRAHISETDEKNDIVLACCIMPKSSMKVKVLK